MQNSFGKFKMNLCTFYHTHRQKVGFVYNRCTIYGFNKPNQLRDETKRFRLSKRAHDGFALFLRGALIQKLFSFTLNIFIYFFKGRFF